MFNMLIATPDVSEISVSEVKERIALSQLSEFKFIDVRTIKEYDEAHIAGIEHREQNPATHAINTDGLRTDDEIIISCQSGRRSAFVTDYLNNAGFTNVKSMKGGIQAWIKAGFNVEETSSLKLGRTG